MSAISTAGTWKRQRSGLALSPPRRPIVFWLENTIPAEYRAAVREGTMIWNKAFEKIGFKDAIQVWQMPDLADWDPADALYTHRNHIGDPAARPPLQVVPAARQKEVLQLISAQLFQAEPFQFSPELLAKLGPERQWDFEGSLFDMGQDLPLHSIVRFLYTRVLSYLMSPILLQRLQDNELRFQKDAERFGLEEHFALLRTGIWQELQPVRPIPSFRRNLQRVHLDQLKALYLGPARVPADARTLARQELVGLRN